MQSDNQDSYKPEALTKPVAERKSIAEQAKALLSGDEEWRITEWEDIGEPQEVEQDLKID
jgi:large subunit ribosomal protein L23